MKIAQPFLLYIDYNTTNPSSITEIWRHLLLVEINSVVFILFFFTHVSVHTSGEMWSGVVCVEYTGLW